MAKYSTASFTDNTSVAVETAACYFKGAYVINPGATATDGWINIWNVAQAGVTIGTTMPDYTFFCPFSTAPNKLAYRFTLPSTFLGTALTVFFSDTAANNASAWNGGTGFELNIFYEYA